MFCENQEGVERALTANFLISLHLGVGRGKEEEERLRDTLDHTH